MCQLLYGIMLILLTESLMHYESKLYLCNFSEETSISCSLSFHYTGTKKIDDGLILSLLFSSSSFYHYESNINEEITTLY
jgi:hypothetical protein